ncbi:MAG: IS200/IS605 family transposase [Alphaproteobacteria bacterium]|nr:IS200/IS605 family transposase [Alphaproteobacteria bacterium]
MCMKTNSSTYSNVRLWDKVSRKFKFTPKYRKKVLFGKIKQQLGKVFHDLARRKECRIEEGHLMADHVHMLISIPPKYSVAEIIGYMKGKSSIWVAQNVERKMRNFPWGLIKSNLL